MESRASHPITVDVNDVFNSFAHERWTQYTLDENAKLSDLKDQIRQRHNIVDVPSSKIVLIYRGQRLNDDSKLTELIAGETMTPKFHMLIQSDTIVATSSTASTVPSTDPNSTASTTTSTGSSSGAESSPTEARGRSIPIVNDGLSSVSTTNPQRYGYSLNDMTPSLHVLNLKVPSSTGDVGISVPCYDYMFVPCENNGLAFYMSPAWLLRLASLGVDVEPRMTSAIANQTSHTNMITNNNNNNNRNNTVNDNDNNNNNNNNNGIARVRTIRFNLEIPSLFNLLRNSFRFLFLLFRILLFIELIAFDIFDISNVWLLATCVVGVVLWQLNVFQDVLRPLIDIIPRWDLDFLPHAHPRVGNDDNEEREAEGDAQGNGQGGVWHRVRSGCLMFVSSLVPPLHDRWVAEDRRRREHVERQERQERGREREEEQEQGQEQEVGQ